MATETKPGKSPRQRAADRPLGSTQGRAFGRRRFGARCSHSGPTRRRPNRNTTAQKDLEAGPGYPTETGRHGPTLYRGEQVHRRQSATDRYGGALRHHLEPVAPGLPPRLLGHGVRSADQGVRSINIESVQCPPTFIPNIRRRGTRPTCHPSHLGSHQPRHRDRIPLTDRRHTPQGRGRVSTGLRPVPNPLLRPLDPVLFHGRPPQRGVEYCSDTGRAQGRKVGVPNRIHALWFRQEFLPGWGSAGQCRKMRLLIFAISYKHSRHGPVLKPRLPSAHELAG